MNNNRYGANKLTTAFQKAAAEQDNLMGRYFQYVGERDTDRTRLEYDSVDYLINTAPEISAFEEKHHTEPFVKVRDTPWGFVIKQRSQVAYYEYNLLRDVRNDETVEEKRARRSAYKRYCPFEMPVRFGNDRKARAIDYIGTPDIGSIAETLSDLVRSGKVLVFKDCAEMGCGVLMRVNYKNPGTNKADYTDFTLIEKEGSAI